MTPIAGDLGDTRMLLWGSNGQAWVLCGSGAELASATLGLVRLGGTVDDQQRYSISTPLRLASGTGGKSLLEDCDVGVEAVGLCGCGVLPGVWSVLAGRVLSRTGLDTGAAPCGQ
ncbi:hypothetical protein, partial [Planotetraspora sp. GP83]|uniref:hypothetical protein n=1 Tax=Planotetraspora sp. GP83 TaxID=3156264 RepID=UPI003513900E